MADRLQAHAGHPQVPNQSQLVVTVNELRDAIREANAALHGSQPWEEVNARASAQFDGQQTEHHRVAAAALERYVRAQHALANKATPVRDTL